MKTKIDIFSGFLGAGKTTLIKKLIAEAYTGEKVVLIENEFGEIGIDGGFLKDAGIQITEMNSGCICCSLVGDFRAALAKVIDEYHPDRIIIEPSGVGKLSDVIRAASTADPEKAELNCFTTVVDAGKCKMYMKNFGEFFNDQIEHASAIVLSHTDAVSAAKVEEAVALLRTHNAKATIVTTPWSELDGKTILAAMEQKDTLEDALELLAHEEEHHHHHHHHDEDDDHCSCGHHHDDDDDDDDCCCGHDHEEHEHHHHHDDDDDDCCCGHDHEGHEHLHHDHDEHEHHHHHDGDCCCGHDHDHHHEEVKEAPPCTSKAPMRIYIVENLDCANCAAKIERKIQSLPGVEYASLTFATKQLRVAAEHQDELFPKMVAACNSIEPDAKIIPREETKKKDDKEEKDESRKNVICIVSGAVLLIAAKIMEKSFPIPSLVLYILAYLILGLEIVITAVKNIFKGNVLDENFLMSIATIGAFATREYPEAVGVMLFYRIGEWFEDKAVERSRSQIMDALDLRPETVQLVEDGNVTTIPAGEAKIGDIVMVRPGDRIPLDGTIIEGESQIDTSAITGEPVPVSVKEGASILSGCMNLNGVLKLKVDKPLAESMVTR
ncbi:MAG TPA: hypothetical protein DDY70_01030, partial [Clostridiales bacterium]|nr:hypothetical protein [Clostridiales bacterium]